MKLFVVLTVTIGMIILCFIFFDRAVKPINAKQGPSINSIDTLVQPLIMPTVTADVPARSTLRDSIVLFAKALLGTPYLYASDDPAKGFDCSGFINYVYHHFNIAVPRSSYEFISIGKKIVLDSCKKGDLILFTGTAPEEKAIGHIGIVCETKSKWPSFIHSSSGKAKGVTITSMESAYYQARFVAAVDILSK